MKIFFMYWITAHSCSGHCWVVRHPAVSGNTHRVYSYQSNNKRACRHKRPGCAR